MVLTQSVFAQSDSEVRKAVNRALPTLQRSAKEFVAKRACVSCHHNILPILTLHLAEQRGFAIDSSVLTAVEEKTLRGITGPNALDDAIQAVTVNDPTPNDSLLLMAADAAGIKPGLATKVYARRLVGWQREGHWITSDFRPPHSSSVFTATATAVRAIRIFMPEEVAAVRSAREWLIQTRPISTEDAAFRVMGLVWASAAAGEIAQAELDLFAMQKPNGGWSQLAGYEPDAYSTGEALFALREAGILPSEAALRRGLRFLISNQASDGTWRVRTRMLSPAEISPKYFLTGFPYGKDEFLSYAGSCWAVMGLVSALPDARQQSTTPNSAVESWIQTALFGSTQELTKLLDAGLDPNRKTERGTTILMAAALDPDKVKVLIARGANVKARSASGADALTIASAYRGTAAPLRLLLDAGAEVQPPKDVRVRNAPIVLASMTGDLENVKLLLSRGAPASVAALSQAVTFGYPDVVKTLIAAGADTGAVESSGINLLHWATVANRPAMIPLLAAARVPINDVDDNGFTPLMYAATIDFGDTSVLEQLLKAGANRSIRNNEKRTPLEQAHHYKHARLEAVLKSSLEREHH